MTCATNYISSMSDGYSQQAPQQRTPGVPSLTKSEHDAMGNVSAESIATEIRDFHWRGLRARKHRDLTAQKYLLHVDGEGGSQWYDLYYGQRLKIPTSLSGVSRVQNNQLRPIVDNYVAHLTTQPYRLVVEASMSREAREAALVDQALINHQVYVQNWNALIAEAKYMACCYGFCPIHAAWRDDMTSDPYEAVVAQDQFGNPMIGPRPGMLDNWVGNPFDTIFDSGARRTSIHRQTFGRVLPADLVRQAFGRTDLEGNERLPSASTYQRIVQQWSQAANMVHGSSMLSMGWGHDELIACIYDEILPGMLPEWPNGRLSIIALQGMSGTSREEARGGIGTPVLLWQGELPGRTFSSVNIYSHQRADDPTGKPFVADIDDDQIQLNQLESMVNEYLRRASKPPLASTGGVNVQSINYYGDTLLELEPLGPGSVEMRYLEYPARHVSILESKINRVLEGMYRKGGWQAASRGEMKGSGKAIIALQQADDSIFGPIAQRTKEEVESFARLNWRLAKQYMDVPMMIGLVGDEVAHLAEPYVDRTMMSERAPMFRLVSGFGTSTEAKAQQLMNLFGLVDQRGEQVIGTRELRRHWPDSSLFRSIDDPAEVRERRPRIINATIRKTAKQFRQMYPQLPFSMSDPAVQQVAMMLTMQVDQLHPALMDDDLQEHITVLSVITQDETEDPLARRIAINRQQQFWMWLAGQQEEKSAQEAKAAQAGGGKAPAVQPSASSTASAFAPKQEGGTPTAASMMQADKQFAKQVRSAP